MLLHRTAQTNSQRRRMPSVELNKVTVNNGRLDACQSSVQSRWLWPKRGLPDPSTQPLDTRSPIGVGDRLRGYDPSARLRVNSRGQWSGILRSAQNDPPPPPDCFATLAMKNGV